VHGDVARCSPKAAKSVRATQRQGSRTMSKVREQSAARPGQASTDRIHLQTHPRSNFSNASSQKLQWTLSPGVQKAKACPFSKASTPVRSIFGLLSFSAAAGDTLVRPDPSMSCWISTCTHRARTAIIQPSPCTMHSIQSLPIRTL
jgi:hypothetical protein